LLAPKGQSFLDNLIACFPASRSWNDHVRTEGNLLRCMSPLLGVKRTWRLHCEMSAFDPKRTFGLSLNGLRLDGYDALSKAFRGPAMKRREFIGILGGAATVWSLAASAQEKPVIGFLNSGSADAYPDRITAFHQGLRQLGYISGENVVVVYRWAFGQYDRLPAFAAELVERRVSVLVATGGEPAALAAKSATSTIPIVFAIGGDPIKLGLVASYNRPGGNATGANILAAETDGKRLG